MPQKTVKTNCTNDLLWCVYSKEKIDIGEQYVEIVEFYRGEEIIKCYKLEYEEFIDDEE